MDRYLSMSIQIASKQPFTSKLSNAIIYSIISEIFTLKGDYKDAEKYGLVYVSLCES